MLGLAAALLLLGPGPKPAKASITDYSTTLYLSGSPSSLIAGSYKLVTAGAPGIPMSTPTAAAGVAGPLSGTYSYEYTIVDPTGGETAPSPVSTGLTVAGASINVNGLPTGVIVRLYRACSGCASTLFYKIAQFVPSSTAPQFNDTVTDATQQASTLPPQSQTKPALSALGYYEFVPGIPLASTTATSTPVASPAFSGKGWVVDNPGRVSIPSGTWTFSTKFKSAANPATNTVHLVIGMWIVDDAGAVVGSPLIDPTGTGENTVTNFASNPGTTAVNTVIAGVPAISIAANQHLYVQFWRRQKTSNTSAIATLGVYDGSASITHPAANAFPDVPTLGSIAARVNTTPTLSAKYSDPDSDTGTVAFQLCSDAACATVLQSGSSAAGLASGANGTWTPTSLADGTYYWRAQSTDSTGNVSGWSATSSFVVDTVPPGVPTFGSPSAGGRANALGATFVDSDSTDSGYVEFQVCSDASCTSPVTSGNSSTVAGGTGVSWTPGGLTGTPPTGYYWRIRGYDVAGNASAWSAIRSFTFDTNAPPVPSLSSPADGAYRGAGLTLSGVFSNNDAGDTGTLDFQVCADNLCGTVLGSGSSSSGLLDGATGSWTATGMVQGINYWRVRARDAAGNASAWSATVRSFTYDSVAPTAPGPASVTARAQTPPQLSSTYADPGATDNGTLLFRICTDSGCTAVVQSHTVSGVANNTAVNWTPSSLADGLYYYSVTATDAAGNASSSSGSFTVDTTAPAKPALVSPAGAARVNDPKLTATFTNSDPTDSGTVTIQLCSDAACTTVLGFSTSGTVASGASFTWDAIPRADGMYYWRASSLDAAGNQGAWSSVRSFVLDTVGPNVPTLVGQPAQINATPSLSASFSDPDAGDTGTVSFQICSDSACTAVVQSGSSPSGIGNGADGSWTAAALGQGSYYWRARAQDAAGNQSAWSGTQQFTLNTTPPSNPVVTASPADGARLNQPPTLSAVYNDPNAETGNLTFELCATSSCSSPLLINSGTAGSLAAGATGSWTPSFLFDGLYYWRVQSTDSAGNTSGWSSVLSFTVDATPPEAPVLSGAPGMRVQATPALQARVDDPTDPGDTARIYVQVCSDADCTTVVASGYSADVPVGTLAGWQAPALADGTYYWRALAEDSVGNRSGWSATRAFVVDTVAPGVPGTGGVGGGAEVNQPHMSGTFVSSAPGDTGTLEFQLCADPDCASIVLSGTSASVAAGGTASWTPDATVLEDGVYFWRVRSEDAAGNDSAWSATSSFTLDRTPPGPPRDFRATVNGRLLTLSWRPPADRSKVRGYALIVNGKRTRTLTPTTLTLRIKLKRHDRRSFAIAAIDSAGNVSDSTRTIATFVPHLSLKQTRSSSTHRH